MMSSQQFYFESEKDKPDLYKVPDFPKYTFVKNEGNFFDFMRSVRKTLLVVSYDTKGKNKINENQIVASCTVELDTAYNTFEIHNVCVAPDHQGKGVCKKFIPVVMNRFFKLFPNMREGRIICERKNKAACSCYTHMLNHFSSKKKFRTERHDNDHISAFMVIA